MVPVSTLIASHTDTTTKNNCCKMEYEDEHSDQTKLSSASDILIDKDNNIICSNIIQNDENNLLLASSQLNRMKVALGIVVRLVLPLINGVARGWQGIRGTNLLRFIKNVQVSRQMLTNLFAFAANSISLSLSTVQVVHKIDPLLKMMKIRKDQRDAAAKSTPTTINNNHLIIPPMIEEPPEKCVTLNILAEPPVGSPIRADVIFIHGLHGSLVNTWKQGLWNSEGRRVNFTRPPKPPVRPPKRQRHSRTTLFDPPHRSKRPRFCPNDENTEDDSVSIDDLSDIPADCSIDYTYDCDDEEDENQHVEYVSDMEYSFPTFRMRVDDEDENVPELSEDEQRQGKPKDKNEELKSEYAKCWPGEWLPIDCPGVRVIALNYTTDPYLWRPLWIRKRNRTSLTERTREMTELLTEIGVGVGHPIIWVGHSKGGIFIKQIIVDAWESGKAALAPLWRQSRGTLFYSVPHRGSPLADFNLPLLRQSVELLEIKKNCSGVLELHRRFVALYRSGHLKIEVFSFVETALTLMSVLYLRIVGIDSADPGIGEVCGVHLDHREICKPRNRDCMLYTKLTKMIKKVS